MSRDINPFGLRMPTDVRARIESAAEASGRSLNAEILQRIEDSFELTAMLAQSDATRRQQEMVIATLHYELESLRHELAKQQAELKSARAMIPRDSRTELRSIQEALDQQRRSLESVHSAIAEQKRMMEYAATTATAFEDAKKLLLAHAAVKEAKKPKP